MVRTDVNMLLIIELQNEFFLCANLWNKYNLLVTLDVMDLEIVLYTNTKRARKLFSC